MPRFHSGIELQSKLGLLVKFIFFWQLAWNLLGIII